MKRSVMFAAALAIGSMASSSSADQPISSPRLLGHPCLSFNMLGGLIADDPKTGHEAAILTNMNEEGGELIIVDLATQQGERIDAPSGAGGWALKEIPGHRIAYGTFYDGHIMIFDLATRKWIKNVKVPGEKYLWNFTIGTDGKLYGGTYGGGKLISINLDSYEIKDHGNGGPPNLYGRYVSALPDGRIVVSYTAEMPRVMLFDPKTESYTSAPESMQKVKDGVCWKDLFVTADAAFDARTLNAVHWPFTVETANGETSATVNVAMSTSGTLYLVAGKAIYRMRDSDAKPTLMSTGEILGSKVIGVTANGTVIGVRGQEFFTASATQPPTLVPMPVKPKPRPSMFLSLDESGNIWGGPEFGQNIFIMNAQNGETTNTQIVTHRGGEVYDAAFKDGIGYLVSYVGGQIIRYDPTKPWDQIGGKNPRPVASVESAGYIRPAAGCTFGPDGKLYSGWWAEYGKFGGVIAITDVKTGKSRFIKDPLGKQGVCGLDVDDKYAYVATGVNGNGMPPMQDTPPKFGMVDLESGKVLFSADFKHYNASDTTTQSAPLILEKKTHRVAISRDSNPVQIFDPVKRSFILESKTANTPVADSRVMASAHNGKVLYGSGRNLIELNMETGDFRVAATLPESVVTIAADPSGLVYIGAGTGVYEVLLTDEDRN